MRSRIRAACALLIGVSLASACSTPHPAAERQDAASAAPAQPPVPLGPAAITPDRSAPDGTPPRRRAEIYPGTPPTPPPRAAPAAATVGETGDVTLNFANTELREVVRAVLGDILHLNYVVDPKVQGTVTAQTSRPLTREAVLTAMEIILRANGATLVRSNDIYNVLPLDEGGRAALAAGPAISDVQRGQGFGLRIIPLKFVGAAEVQKVLEPFLPAGGTLRTEAARNLLIVSGSQPELDSFVALAATVDIDFLAGTSFALLPLENASPQGLAGELERIFGNQSEGALAGVLRFIPIDRLNAILAVSSQPAYLARARAR